MMIITIFLFIIFIFYILDFRVKLNRSGRLVDQIPGPSPSILPLVGNLLQLNLPEEKLWSYVRESMNKYYPIGRAWLGTYAWILTRDPVDFKIMLSSKENITKANFYRLLSAVSGTNIFTSTGEKWAARRRIISPAFNKNMFETYTDIANDHAKNLVTHLKSQGYETIQHLQPLVKKYTLNVLCASVMGINLNTLEPEVEEKFRLAIDEILRLVTYRTVRPYIRDWMTKFLSIGRKQKEMREIICQFIDKIIKNRKKYHENNGYTDFEDYDNLIATKGALKKFSVLDLLLLAQKNGQIDDQGIREEIEAIITGGYESTAVTLMNTLLLLADNKKEQELARAEAFKILDENKGEITTVELKKFDYIQRCIKESLRMLPAVPHISRNITKEIKLNHYTIPVKQEVLLCIFDLHNDAKYWPEPNKFDPDRFLTERLKESSHAFYPFSAGPRNCLGQQFALMELTATIGHILYNYNLKPVDSIEKMQFKLHIVLSPVTSVRLKFVEINKKNE